jgi:cold shock protein
MPKGTIKKLVQDKGFGFIKQQGGQDVFFHTSVVAGSQFDDLAEGQEVEFTLDQASGGKGKGPKAASVTPA